MTNAGRASWFTTSLRRSVWADMTIRFVTVNGRDTLPRVSPPK